MRQIVISIPVDADKLEAIRQFTPTDKPPIEEEITAFIEQIFVKRVPKPVQQFIENRTPEATSEPTKKVKTTGGSLSAG